ncbi:MAG: hypothetical protein J0H62_06875, partial [Rhizobiales bacterium]|nr:hypothetical protein [Hyphomicrobiales bacterium]
LMSMLPDDPEGYLRRFKKPRDGQETDPAPATPAEPGSTRSDMRRPGRGTDEQLGYGRADRVGMQQLVNTAAPKTR